MTAATTSRPSLLSRIAGAILRRGPGGEKDLPLSRVGMAFLRGDTLPATGQLGGPADPYSQSLWVYRSVSVIARSVAGVPLRISRGPAAGTRQFGGFKHLRWGRQAGRLRPAAQAKAREGELIEAGPLVELLKRPNPAQSWREFCELTIGLLHLPPGRVHWLFNEMVGRRPVEIRVIPGGRTAPLTSQGRGGDDLLGWALSGPRGEKYPPMTLDECVTFQHLHPLKPLAGLSPVQPAHLAIVSDYNASLYNAAMFGNSAEPGGALKTAAPYNAELDEQLRTSWLQRHGGPGRAKAPAVLWGGLEWQAIASTMQDMQYDLGKRLTRTETCAAFGVPEVVAGFYTDANYQFAATGQEQFWWATAMPLLERLAEAINLHVAGRFDGGLEAWFDVEEVSVVERMRANRLENVEKLWTKGVPLADLDDLYDLGLPSRPWHAQGFLPAGILPAADVAEGNVFPRLPEGPTAPENDALDQERTPLTPAGVKGTPHALDARRRQGDAALAKAALDRIWSAWAASWNGLAKVVRAALRARWFAQQRKVADALRRGAPQAPANAPTDQPINRSTDNRRVFKQDVLARLLAEIFADPADRARFRARMRTFIGDATELGLRQACREAGLTDEQAAATARRLLSEPRIIQAMLHESVRVSTLIDSATERLLRRSLADGLEAGEDIRRLTDRVEAVMGRRRAAAMTISRNAVGQALSRSRQEGQAASGMTHKVWVHSRGPGHRRPGHVAAEARYAAEPCEIARPFLVNGVALMFPRDASAGRPEETVNCQCLSLGRRLSSRDRERAVLSPTAPRFYAYDDMLSERHNHEGTKAGD